MKSIMCIGIIMFIFFTSCSNKTGQDIENNYSESREGYIQPSDDGVILTEETYQTGSIDEKIPSSGENIINL